MDLLYMHLIPQETRPVDQVIKLSTLLFLVVYTFILKAFSLNV